MKKRTDIIKEKIEKLISLDSDHKIFGAFSHEYIQNSPLTSEQINEYERTHNIILPHEYKEFLLDIADGDVGPFYGLYPLLFNDDLVLKLDKEFPFTLEDPFILSHVYDSIPDDLSDEEEEEYYDKIYSLADCGHILLATEGCGMYSALIVNGREYGNIWFKDLANDAGMFPLTNPKDSKPLGFYDWYELWLDKSIESLVNNSEGLSSYADFIKECE